MATTTTVKVRHLMADVGDEEYLSDDQIGVYLELNDDDVRLAAADALDAIATSEVLIGKVIRTQDLQTDGAKVADSLRKHADRLRDQAERESAHDIFDVVFPPSGLRPEHTNRPTVSGL